MLPIVERTFLHLPGIGPKREQLLWRNGIRSWEDLERALLAGVPPVHILRGAGKGVGTSRSRGQQLSVVASQWLTEVKRSRAAIRTGAVSSILSALSPSHHWRVLSSMINESLFLDIETTGLSRHWSYITLIGALFKGEFHQWAWPDSLDTLASLLQKAPLVVTFNGGRFDLPFLRAQLPFLPEPRAHIDLLSVVRALGLKGGLKDIERYLRIRRQRDARNVDGPEAVALWFRALYGDSNSFKTLVAYNRADVSSLPQIAAEVCRRLTKTLHQEATAPPQKPNVRIKTRRAPTGHVELRNAWKERRASFKRLLPGLDHRGGTLPVVVGIDLRGNPERPTGWAKCEGPSCTTKILFDDDEIVRATLSARPRLVSIDAPLFLPRGRRSPFDDSPCRQTGGIVRDAERILWSRGIRVYPALIRHMQGLTNRGITITQRLRQHGVEVIESYPGAAQDILGIPRKGADVELLGRGLAEFGLDVPRDVSHDELDAVTSAMVGYFFLANQFEGIGAADEGFMIVPRWRETQDWRAAPATDLSIH